MTSLPQEALQMDIYAKPEAPVEKDRGHLDAGHVFFSAVPRPATPPLVVTEAKSGAGERGAAGAEASSSAAQPSEDGSPKNLGEAEVLRSTLQLWQRS